MNRIEDMTIFIFAAGRGKRMMPLTAKTPKPLLKIGKLSLIEHVIHRLSSQGFKNFIINIDYFGDKIIEKLSQGKFNNLNIRFSDERKTGALETAGAIRQAYDLIESDDFLAINADIWIDFDFKEFVSFHDSHNKPASIVLVPNPEHNPEGDFSFDESKRIVSKIEQNSDSENTYTFAGIGIYNKLLFSEIAKSKQPLAPLLLKWIEQGDLYGLIHSGQWHDIGTPARLKRINNGYLK